VRGRERGKRGRVLERLGGARGRGRQDVRERERERESVRARGCWMIACGEKEDGRVSAGCSDHLNQRHLKKSKRRMRYNQRVHV
jgi:hypothetical protein